MIQELLDDKKIFSMIDPAYLSGQALGLEIVHSIDSTNSYLLNKAKTGDAQPGFICLAEQQTQGRATKGRSWYSPYAKNIYCSLLWQFPQRDLSGLSLAVAVMVLDALEQYGINTGLQLKWPNDLWYRQRKLAGILIEMVRDQVVIGIGLNLTLPEDHPPEWIAIDEITAKQPERNRMAGLLINALLRQLPIYQHEGFAPFLPIWKRHDVLLGQFITVHTTQKIITGRSEGVNDKGELLLRDSTGHDHAFRNGEVSLQLVKV